MDDFTGEVTKAIENVFGKVKEYGGYAKVQAQIKAEEAKKQEQFYRLGKKYYELYKDAPASDLSEIMNKLLDADKKIEEFRQQIQDSKDAKAAEAAEDEDIFETVDATVTEVAEDITKAAEDVAEDAADAVEEAVEDAKDAAEEAAEDLTDGAKEAAETIRESFDARV